MNNLSFIERNEGAIISTLGAALIAIFAAFLTYYLSQKQDSKNKKNAYNGILYALNIELHWHQNHIKLLENSLKAIETVSRENSTFIIDNPPTQFNLQVCENTLSKIINYKRFNHEIVALLTSYLNQIRNINYFIDFKNANSILSKVDNIEEKKVHIKNYFETLKSEHIDKTKISLEELTNIINDELKDYYRKKENNTAYSRVS